ncbi:MAG: pitrilysin family protein [Acidobacteriota bacterium]|nr:insulinase family protein [Blastocatellia bacterium]MDW8412492.1 pitrilysin family protein [Acidobacteriota bacterium]
MISLCSDVRRTVLSNGLTVLTKEVHSRPIVSQMIWYRVGSRNEELGQTGKSHFLEHMLFKGTNKYAKGEIDLVTTKNGGHNNAFTWLDFTSYYFTFASDRWHIALDIEASRMRETIFSPEEFAAEKQVVIEELQIGQDGPWDALEEEVWATAFKQHPYHNPTVGWMNDLINATVEDMRAYYDQWYHPRNAILVLTGDFNTDDALERIERLFGHIPAGPEPKRFSIVEPPQRGEKRVVVKRPTPVERLMIAFHAPSVSNSDSFPMQLLAMLLSSGRRSRLYQRLQEEDQSVTYAKASFHDHIDPPLFYIQAEVRPGKTLSSVEAAILEVLEELATKPVSEAELERVKRQIEANFILGHETVLEQAMLLGQFETIAQSTELPETERGYLYLDHYLEHIKAVTAEDIMRVAAKYFSDRSRTVGLLVNDGNSARSTSAKVTLGHYKHSRYGICYRKMPKPDIERTTLDSGLKLLTAVTNNVPAVSLHAVVNAGARYEPEEKAGLSSLLGEMLDEGTERRSFEEIAEQIENVGGHLRSFGGYAQSGISITVLKSDLDLGIDLLADILTRPTFPKQRLDKQLDRHIAQIKSREDNPKTVASDALNEIIYRGHPAHRPRIGYLHTVSNISRDDLVAFHEEYFCPNNAILAVVGDINREEVKLKLERALALWKPKQLRLPAVPEINRQREPISKYIHKEKEQVNIFMGHLGIKRTNPDYYALLVLDTILGSSPGFTSRIPRRLRDEQGLAYHTYSNITRSAGIDPGRFVAFIGTSPENRQKATDLIIEELKLITETPVTGEELQVAKDYLTGSFVFNLETNAQIAGFLVKAEIFDLGLDYLERFPTIIEAISVDEVYHVAKKYLDPVNLTVVVVGAQK